MQPPCCDTILEAWSLRLHRLELGNVFPPVAESCFPHQLLKETVKVAKESLGETKQPLDPARSGAGMVSQAQKLTCLPSTAFVDGGLHRIEDQVDKGAMLLNLEAMATDSYIVNISPQR
jgi:hypothetical protein